MMQPEEFSELVLQRIKGSAHTYVNPKLVRHAASVDVVVDAVAEDLWHTMLELYVPGTEHKVDRKVWVEEVPATRWDMFKAALGLPHATRDICAPDTTVFKVCPQLELRGDQLAWMGKAARHDA